MTAGLESDNLLGKGTFGTMTSIDSGSRIFPSTTEAMGPGIRVGGVDEQASVVVTGEPVQASTAAEDPTEWGPWQRAPEKGTVPGKEFLDNCVGELTEMLDQGWTPDTAGMVSERLVGAGGGVGE